MSVNYSDPRSALTGTWVKPRRTVSSPGGGYVQLCDNDPSRLSLLVLWPSGNQPIYVKPDSDPTTPGIAGGTLTGSTLIHSATYPNITQGQLFGLLPPGTDVHVYETCVR